MYERGEPRNPYLVYVFTMVSCGLYGIYFLSQYISDLNKALGRQEYDFVKILLFNFLTCGAYGIFFFWQSSQSFLEIEEKWQVEPKFDPIALFVSQWFVFGILPQMELNHIWETGTIPSDNGGGNGGSTGAGRANQLNSAPAAASARTPQPQQATTTPEEPANRGGALAAGFAATAAAAAAAGSGALDSAKEGLGEVVDKVSSGLGLDDAELARVEAERAAAAADFEARLSSLPDPGLDSGDAKTVRLNWTVQDTDDSGSDA